MKLILWCSSRLLYLVSVVFWLAAASPVVEAAGYKYEILSQYSPVKIWWVLLFAGIVTCTCAAVLHCLARLEEDIRTIKRIVIERR